MTTEHPEDGVIADIEALIDAQLAGGPVDDYEADRYDKCEMCRNDWHGTPNGTGCPGAWADAATAAAYRDRLKVLTTPYTDMVEGITMTAHLWLPGEDAPVAGTVGFNPAGWLNDASGVFNPDGTLNDDGLVAGGWVDLGHLDENGLVLEERPPGSGYTLADLQALRGRMWQQRDIPRPVRGGRWPMLATWTHRLRFWALAVAYGHGPGNRLSLAEINGVQVQEVTVTSHGDALEATLRCMVHHPAEISWQWAPTEEPLSEVTEGRLNVEWFQPDGWKQLGHAPGDGMNLECHAVMPPRPHWRDRWRGTLDSLDYGWSLQFDITLDEPYTDTIDRLLYPPERRT